MEVVQQDKDLLRVEERGYVQVQDKLGYFQEGVAVWALEAEAERGLD
jgi:hypothetical protein